MSKLAFIHVLYNFVLLLQMSREKIVVKAKNQMAHIWTYHNGSKYAMA
jgi:hypothetical protein